MPRLRASDFDKELLYLYDAYAHGQIDRREFLKRATRFASGGLTAVALLHALGPDYALAAQVAADDPRLATEHRGYPSPEGAGNMRGYLARPAQASGPLPGVLVIHENRGLNPYIEDVTRRLGVAGLVAFAPDALYPLGGYPGDDDRGREMQRQRDVEEMTRDFMAGALALVGFPECNGTVGVVGFCFGGGMANTLAVRLPDLIVAAVPFYGRQPAAADVPRIRASLMLHYAALDERINAGWPAYEEALEAAGVDYVAFMYDDVHHGFHNDTTPRYDEAAAALAWERTIAFFSDKLGGA